MSDTVKLIIEIPKSALELLNTTGVDWLDAEHILSAVAHGTPLDDVKAEIEDCSFDYYFEYGEYIGENPIQHRICMTDKVLEILSEYQKGGE